MPIPAKKNFSQSGSEVLPEKWWLTFEDKALNTLIRKSISDNFTLQGAWDRLVQARAVARKSGSERFPSLDGTAGLSRSKIRSSGNSTNTTTYSLGLAAHYEIDLWGRVRAGYQASELDVLAAKEDLHAGAIALSTEVASVWYRLLEQRLQIKLLDEQIHIKEKHVDLVTHQFKSGKAPATDVLQQLQTLEASRGDKIRVTAAEKVLMHQLAVLAGESPGYFQIPDRDSLTALPPLPKTGLPSELIQRRPDIRRAYLQLQAADSRVAVAIADRFPKVSLIADAETSDNNISDLFDNWLATIAGNLLVPILDGGRKKAEVERTKAFAAEALHSYGQTILISLKEVEDALVSETQQRKFMDSLDKQLILSQQSIDQIRDRYLFGDVEFLRFLTALLSHQGLQRSRLQAQRELIEFRINLCRAMAGGWQMQNKANIQ